MRCHRGDPVGPGRGADRIRRRPGGGRDPQRRLVSAAAARPGRLAGAVCSGDLRGALVAAATAALAVRVLYERAIGSPTQRPGGDQFQRDPAAKASTANSATSTSTWVAPACTAEPPLSTPHKRSRQGHQPNRTGLVERLPDCGAAHFQHRIARQEAERERRFVLAVPQPQLVQRAAAGAAEQDIDEGESPR